MVVSGIVVSVPEDKFSQYLKTCMVHFCFHKDFNDIL